MRFTMVTEDKVTEIFCIADDLALPIFNFASFFDAMMIKTNPQQQQKAVISS